MTSTESPLPPPSSSLFLPLLIALSIIGITALTLFALHLLITKLCTTTAVSLSARRSTGRSGFVDKAVLASIPVYLYAKEVEEQECAVCLGVLEHGERVRALPGCCHVFHVDCIDRWLTTHSEYCPLCRTVVDLVAAVALPIEVSEGLAAAGDGGGGGSQTLLVRSGSLLWPHAASSLLSFKEKLRLKRSLSMRCFNVSIQHQGEPYHTNV